MGKRRRREVSRVRDDVAEAVRRGVEAAAREHSDMVAKIEEREAELVTQVDQEIERRYKARLECRTMVQAAAVEAAELLEEATTQARKLLEAATAEADRLVRDSECLHHPQSAPVERSW